MSRGRRCPLASRKKLRPRLSPRPSPTRRLSHLPSSSKKQSDKLRSALEHSIAVAVQSIWDAAQKGIATPMIQQLQKFTDDAYDAAMSLTTLSHDKDGHAKRILGLGKSAKEMLEGKTSAFIAAVEFLRPRQGRRGGGQAIVPLPRRGRLSLLAGGRPRRQAHWRPR